MRRRSQEDTPADGEEFRVGRAEQYAQRQLVGLLKAPVRRTGESTELEDELEGEVDELQHGRSPADRDGIVQR